MKHLLVPANRDATVMIRDDAQHLMHVRLSKRDYNPNDPNINSEFSRVVTYRPNEFEKNERMMYDSKIKIDWVKAAGFQKAEVVHDGRLFTKGQKEKVEITVKDEPVEEIVKKAVSEAVKKERRKSNYRASLQNTAK